MTDDIIKNLENLQIDDSSIEINARKLFVGGLSWLTNEDGLRQYFENLGLHVDTVSIMRDKRGRSRGFGFLTLASPKEIQMALSFHLYIDGRKVEAKRAIPQSDMSNHAKKIFVGGLPISLTNFEFRKYFEAYGNVLESQIMTDRDSGRSRGFGFVTFELEKTAEDVLALSHSISGKPVEVKQAEPKSPQSTPYPVTPVFISSNFAYSSVFSPISLDQATYMVQTQGGIVYIPNMYETSSIDSVDKSNINIADSIRRSNTAPIIQKPTNSVPIPVPTIVYDKPEKILSNSATNNSQLRSTTMGPKVLEMRTDRAFSEPWLETSEKVNINVDGAATSTSRLGRLSPPIKRRLGPLTIQATSQPPLLRRTENWSSADTSVPAVHKYFQ